MGLKLLFSAAAMIVITAASTGQLPRMVKFVRKAQLQLIQDSKASKWGRPMLLPEGDLKF